MIPAYSANRLYAVFFLAFSVIGTYFLMNLLTAIIYNQFRGYLVNSIRTMLLRRRVGVRAAFEILSAHELQRNPTDAHEESVTGALVMRVLRTISVDSAHRKAMIQHLSGVGDGSISSETFQKIFEEMDKDTVKEVPSAPQYDHRLLVLLQRVCRHRYFDYVGNVFALANVLCITVELAIDARKAPDKRDDYFLGVMNCSFIAYYLLEQLLKLLALGWRSFTTSTSNAMDGAFTLCLVVVEIVCVSVYGFPTPRLELCCHEY
ncbi:two pore channel protein 2-like [Petromyzon marinus]|uniref:two pore channel protein 2-like n=1 Tax=Petromyzon marinus TaxID=7757 RepID=UPI003F6F7128